MVHDIMDRVFLDMKEERLSSGERKLIYYIEENCECMINPGPEGPIGGEFSSPYLESPDPNCEMCEGEGRFSYTKEEIMPPLNDSPIPF